MVCLARPDVEIQGEYVGVVRAAGGAEQAMAAQVVARGGGAFTVVFHPGGLPGAGYAGAGKSEAEAETIAGIVRITGDIEGTIDGDSLLAGKKPGAVYALAKAVRVSPTLGLKPPAQAAVLFDGSAPSAWRNGVLDSSGWFAPLEREAVTLAGFSDFSLHVEFRLPFLPHLAGQSRANSGLRFLTDKLLFSEIQILDSFGGQPGTEECGGIESEYPPLVMAAFPPLSWQTLDIHLTTPAKADTVAVGNGRMTVWHNGILIHPGREMPYMGSEVNIALQNLDAPGAFRNIWLVEGNDHYPFLPGMAARRRDAGPRATRARRNGDASRVEGPRGGYRADGVRIAP